MREAKSGARSVVMCADRTHVTLPVKRCGQILRSEHEVPEGNNVVSP